MKRMKLRIVVADDISESRRIIADILARKFDVVAERTDGFSALDAIREFKPHVAVLDLSMPGLSGIEVTRQAVKDQPNLAVVICSVHRDVRLIQAAADAGARGYIFKLNLVQDLVDAVARVAGGQAFFPARV